MPSDLNIYPDLILRISKYLLLQIHRHRKAELVSSLPPPIHSLSPTIVAPIIQGLVHIEQYRRIRADLEVVAVAMRHAGLDGQIGVRWDTKTQGTGMDDMWRMMSGSVSLQVEEL